MELVTKLFGRLLVFMYHCFDPYRHPRLTLILAAPKIRASRAAGNLSETG